MNFFGSERSAEDGETAEPVRSRGLSEGVPTPPPEKQPNNLAHGADNRSHLDALVRAIECEIIPRLILSHSGMKTCLPTVQRSSPMFSQSEVDSFTAMVIEPDEDILRALLNSLRRREVSIEGIYLELLAPVARRLGELWEQDLCSFSDVTIGLGKLHQILRDVRPSIDNTTDNHITGLNILLAACPGEQHNFGVSMVGEFFHQAGWNVELGVAPMDPVDKVARKSFHVIGLSMAADIFRSRMAKCIQEVRRASMNQGIIVLVGGPAFLTNPSLATELQADAMAVDGKEACQIALSMVAERMARHRWGAKV